MKKFLTTFTTTACMILAASCSNDEPGDFIDQDLIESAQAGTANLQFTKSNLNKYYYRNGNWNLFTGVDWGDSSPFFPDEIIISNGEITHEMQTFSLHTGLNEFFYIVYAYNKATISNMMLYIRNKININSETNILKIGNREYKINSFYNNLLTIETSGRGLLGWDDSDTLWKFIYSYSPTTFTGISNPDAIFGVDEKDAYRQAISRFRDKWGFQVNLKDYLHGDNPYFRVIVFDDLESKLGI